MELLLHSISDGPGPLCLSRERFRSLCRWNPGCGVTFDDGYADVFDALRDAGPELLRRTTVFLVAGRVGGRNDWDRSGPLAGKPSLDWGRIAELRRMGVRVGSHGMTHAELTALDAAGLEREVLGSKELLQDKLGEAVDVFSYPYGSYDRRVLSVVARHYDRAVAARYSRGSGDRYALPRIPFAGDNSEWLFRLKASCLWLYDLRAAFTATPIIRT